ncbi:hypothetical protein JRQ81_009551 [Phrynocephalus forsythii]|uniref:Ankyrin repeat domain-containing protein 35 n=1 Tax=Phrynocephalus forsythii TaxID=171643 RepID=A0A9Q0XAI4_9SAUR|nr:hypothetical protein JRQ81_009551 [Phrynocephalus forsythii]
MLGRVGAGEKAGAAMKKMFSCSSNQVAVETWNKQDQKLLDAVEKGDVGRVSVLMAKKTARPTKANALGQSAFHLAASKGLTECLTVLLTYGAEVNAKNDDGGTALHLAIIACQPQCVKVLLQDGRTPLMVAAQGKQPAICSQLLQRGAKVDVADKDGKTALMMACESGSTEVVELLLQSGANVAQVDRAGHDALYYATRAKDRVLRRVVRKALRRWKKRGDASRWREFPRQISQQLPSESERETDGSTLTLQSEARDQSHGEEDEEEEEGSELKEWRTRYREEKMRVIQLELQLAQKAKECQALSEGCQAMKERVWHQVQEIRQLFPEGDDNRVEGWKELSRRYSRDSMEEDNYLDLLAEEVQELKRKKQKLEVHEKGGPPKGETQGRKADAVAAAQEGKIHRWLGQEEEEEHKCRESEVKRLQAEVAAALEEKASADKRMQEMEGHMENMRAVIQVHEAKRKNQSGAMKELEARVQELEGENQRLRGLLGQPEREATRKKVCQFLTDMEMVYFKVQKENCLVVAQNAALKQEVEDTLRSELQSPTAAPGAVRRSAFAWKEVTEGLEGALARLGQVNTTFLEKGRALLEAITAPPLGGLVNGNGPLAGEKPTPGSSRVPKELTNGAMGKNQLPNSSVRPVELRGKPDASENKAGPRRKSSDLEKEVRDLKQSNGGLAKELAELSRERQKLQEELRMLKEETPWAEVTRSSVAELERAVEVLTWQLLAEKEASRQLNLKLEAQRKEMESVKDHVLEKTSQEAQCSNGAEAESLGSGILKELHWKLDKVAKKQSEALQLVSEIEEENHNLEAEHTNGFPGERRPPPEVSLATAEAAGDNARFRQRVNELEKGLQDLKAALEGAGACLSGGGHLANQGVKQLLDQVMAEASGLLCTEEEALQKHEKVCGMLSVRAEALGGELASLHEKYVAARAEGDRHKDALAAERRKNEALQAKAAEQEEEAGELRRKVQMMGNVMEALNKKVEELTWACQAREAKIKKLLTETEKLSSEVLNLRSERARLQLHLEVVQKNHQEIVTIYRTHLLNAAQGFMDKEVHSMLVRILQTNS